MLWDHRTRPLLFAGIALQEYDAKAGKLVGPRKNIFQGTDLKLVEGPHLYQAQRLVLSADRRGRHRLRARLHLRALAHIDGPYELHPQKYIITAKDAPLNEVQRSGHGDIVDTPDGTHLPCPSDGPPDDAEAPLRARPRDRHPGSRMARRRLALGQERPTCPRIEVNVPGTRDDTDYWAEQRYGFAGALHKDFQWLRTPETDRIFKLEGGKLRLFGRESIGSWFEQSLVARRVTHFSFDAETTIDFSPDRRAAIRRPDALLRPLQFPLPDDHRPFRRQARAAADELAGELPGRQAGLSGRPGAAAAEGPVRLKIEVRGAALQYFYAPGIGGNWQPVGPVLDASLISDECGGHAEHGSFTGGFIGIACSDLNGTALAADMHDFVYRPVHHETDRY